MRRIVSLLATMLLAAPQIAVAAERPCLTPREFTALSNYALPSAIGGTSRVCAAALPADAYLPRHGAELAQRYSVGKARAWPEAKAAFLKLSAANDAGASQLFSVLPDDSLQQIADAALAGIVSDKIKPGSCPTIDRVISLLAPLPAENTAELIALAIGLGTSTEQSKVGNIAICKA